MQPDLLWGWVLVVTGELEMVTCSGERLMEGVLFLWEGLSELVLVWGHRVYAGSTGRVVLCGYGVKWVCSARILKYNSERTWGLNSSWIYSSLHGIHSAVVEFWNLGLKSTGVDSWTSDGECLVCGLILRG